MIDASTLIALLVGVAGGVGGLMVYTKWTAENAARDLRHAIRAVQRLGGKADTTAEEVIAAQKAEVASLLEQLKKAVADLPS